MNKACSMYIILLLALLILPRSPKFRPSYEPHDVGTTFTLKEVQHAVLYY